MKNASNTLLSEYENISICNTYSSIPYFITIDSDEMWYGNINFMNINPNNDNEGTALHIYDKHLAARIERLELFI